MRQPSENVMRHAFEREMAPYWTKAGATQSYLVDLDTCRPLDAAQVVSARLAERFGVSVDRFREAARP